METFSVRIPTPCRESWSNMTPTEKGRHCDVCNLVVIDFSSLSMEEVKEYFQNNCGKKVCGRVRENQLEGFISKNNALQRLHHCLVDARAHYPRISIFMCILAGALALAGCESQDYRRTAGEMVPVDSTCLKPDSTVK